MKFLNAPLDAVMLDRKKSYAFCGLDPDNRDPKVEDDFVDRIAVGKRFAGIVVRVVSDRHDSHELGDGLRERGFRLATLAELMSFAKCHKNVLLAQRPVHAFGSIIWMPGSFYCYPFLRLTGKPRVAVNDGRFGITGARFLAVRLPLDKRRKAC